MDLERWTDVETLDCLSVGFRVATALAMTGFRNPNPGPEYLDVFGTLNHCTGAMKCGLVLPATSGDVVFANCPVSELMRQKLGELPRVQLLAVGE